jgi:hypothetical protein
MDYYLVLEAKVGDEMYWRQPLIILQDQYSSELLNEWDGSLQIDNSKNAILSAMLVAGAKNGENQFTGVVMGEIGDLESKVSSDSGILGYHEGAQSFGFKTDGTAFIGKTGGGRIEFDGDTGIIESANYNENFGS